MAFTAKHTPADLWLERDLVMPPAMVANYLKSLRGILSGRRFLCTASWAPLRRHHVPLITQLLFLFGEKKSRFALNA